MKKLVLNCLIIVLLIINSCKKENVNIPSYLYECKDVDGNTYKTVKIGNQVWMAENLKVTHYQNGDLIPNVIEDLKWGTLSNGAYCNYNNDTTLVKFYGRLYNWFCVNDNRILSPKGWHIPSDTEWQELCEYLGGNEIAGGKMKERGTNHWNSPNTEASNESGFSALSNGSRSGSHFNNDFKYSASWWSTTEYSNEKAWWYQVQYSDSKLYERNMNKQIGLAIRCIKD